MLTLVPVTPLSELHVLNLVDDVIYDLRPDDVQEILNASKCGIFGLRSHVWRGIGKSRCVWVATDGNEPVALLGLSALEMFPGVGGAWLIATPGVTRVGLSITKAAKDILVASRSQFPAGYMANSWDGNKLHQRWLRSLGFTERKCFFKTLPNFTLFSYSHV